MSLRLYHGSGGSARYRRSTDRAPVIRKPPRARKNDGKERKPLSVDAQRVLAELTDEPVRPRDLERQLDLTSSATSNALMRLSERDLAIRTDAGWRRMA